MALKLGSEHGAPPAASRCYDAGSAIRRGSARLMGERGIACDMRKAPGLTRNRAARVDHRKRRRFGCRERAAGGKDDTKRTALARVIVARCGRLPRIAGFVRRTRKCMAYRGQGNAIARAFGDVQFGSDEKREPCLDENRQEGEPCARYAAGLTYSRSVALSHRGDFPREKDKRWKSGSSIVEWRSHTQRRAPDCRSLDSMMRAGLPPERGAAGEARRLTA